MTKFVIEIIHFDDWMFEEYKQCSKYVGKENIIFCNVKDEKIKEKLANYGTVKEESVTEFLKNQSNVVILDPSSPIKATPEILQKAKYIVIGGILGNIRPKKRTRKLISSKLENAIKVNIGKRQFSVDGACFIAKEILNGKRLEEIKYVNYVKVHYKEGNIEVEVSIPFAYPVKDGKIMISEEILRLIKEGYTYEGEINFEE